MDDKMKTMSETEKEKEDEYYSDKAFYGNYSMAFWFKAGGLFLFGKNAGPILIPVLFFTTAPILLGLLAISIIKTHGKNLEVFCEAIHFTIFMIIEMFFLVAFYLKKSTIMQLFVVMGKGFYDYENTLEKDCLHEIAMTLDRATRNKKLVAKTFTAIVMCACFSITILRPMIKYFLGDHLLADDGIERLLPVSIWTPFSKDQWYGTILLFLMEDVISYITPGIVFGCTLFIVCSCEDVGAQLIILGHTLQSVTRRAQCLQMPKDEAIKLCFKHSIKHHQTLIKFIDDLESILYLPGLGLFSGSTLLMCMSGFIFVSDEVSFISKIVFLLFLISELILIFIICWYGEYLQQTSTEIGNMVYSSEWTEDMMIMKNYILIIQLRSSRPLRINFGGFMVASLETYSNICSSAFSYFNLMLAVN